MKYYKGFNEDLTCRGFQYEIGKEYTEEKADLCNSGFHACEYPLDVFGYYDPANSRFCEVELGEVCEKTDNDTKRCGKKIKIGAELDIKGLIKAAFTYTKERCTNSEIGGDRSALTGGDSSALTGGNWSALRGGADSKFKGGKFAVFACEVRNEFGEIIDVKTAVVDDKNIKENTWYTLKDDEWVEVQE